MGQDNIRRAERQTNKDICENILRSYWDRGRTRGIASPPHEKLCDLNRDQLMEILKGNYYFHIQGPFWNPETEKEFQQWKTQEFPTF